MRTSRSFSTYNRDAQTELIAWDATGVEPKEVGRYKVGDTPTWAHPVLLGDRVLIKEEGTISLWRFGP